MGTGCIKILTFSLTSAPAVPTVRKPLAGGKSRECIISIRIEWDRVQARESNNRLTPSWRKPWLYSWVRELTHSIFFIPYSKEQRLQRR